VSSALKILDREYSYIPTDKGLNYIIAQEFKEIFIDVFEINCGANKIIAEKVDSINGDPVIKIDTQYGNQIYSTLFVLREGENNIVLNTKSLSNGRKVFDTEKTVMDGIVTEFYNPSVTNINQEKAAAIEALHESYIDKKHKIDQFRQSITELIDERISQIKESSVSTINLAKDNLTQLVEKSINANRIDRDSTLAEINSIRENIISTVEIYSDSINQTAEEKTTQLQELQEKVKYEVDTKLADLEVETKSQLQHISEAYDSIKTFIATTKEEFLNEKTSNAATIEKLFEVAKLTVESNIKRAESLVGKKLSKLQSVTDKKVNDITSLIESKISYFDEKAQQLQTNVDEFNSVLSEQVQKAIDQIAVESQDKLIDFDRTKEEINQLVESNTTELQNLKTQFTEAIDKKIKDIKSVAISKEDLNQLKKQFESRFETESANIKKYVASYGGGGGNGSGGGGGTGGNQTLSFNEATAALSISNGNTVSLSSLSLSGGGVSGNYLPLTGGTITGNVTVNGILSSSQIIYASSGNSNQWGSVFTTVQSNSATTWNYQGTDIKALTGNWQNTYTTVQSNSAIWNQIAYLPLSGGTLTGTVSTNQDIEITDSTKGIILKSPSNFKYRVTVNDAGELVTTLI